MSVIIKKMAKTVMNNCYLAYSYVPFSRPIETATVLLNNYLKETISFPNNTIINKTNKFQGQK